MTEPDVAILSGLPDQLLAAALRECCGSSRWVDAVMQKRPFRDQAAVMGAADAAFHELNDDDWLEAFASLQVDSVPDHADAGTRAAAELALRLYHDRFGHAFVAVAPGLAADELLMRVRIRLGNGREAEASAAREELRRVVRQRVVRLLERGAHRA